MPEINREPGSDEVDFKRYYIDGTGETMQRLLIVEHLQAEIYPRAQLVGLLLQGVRSEASGEAHRCEWALPLDVAEGLAQALLNAVQELRSSP